jgi:hypothetical protein
MRKPCCNGGALFVCGGAGRNAALRFCIMLPDVSCEMKKIGVVGSIYENIHYRMHSALSADRNLSTCTLPV